MLFRTCELCWKIHSKFITDKTPLRNLLEKNYWNWNHEHDAAIKTIKNTITTKPTLQFFDSNKQAQIQVDASSHALGACLMQDNRPICYASQSLKPCEIQYAQIETFSYCIWV